MSALAVLLAVPLVAGAAVAALALKIRRDRRRANQVVPGVDGPAPASWAGAHTPEARLHRRLRDAMAALRAVPAFDGAATLHDRAELDRFALALDQRLVAVAAVPASARAPALARVTADIEALESAVGALATQLAEGGTGVDDVLGALSERIAHLDEARAELDALEAGASPPATDPRRPGH